MRERWNVAICDPVACMDDGLSVSLLTRVSEIVSAGHGDLQSRIQRHTDQL